MMNSQAQLTHLSTLGYTPFLLWSSQEASSELRALECLDWFKLVT